MCLKTNKPKRLLLDRVQLNEHGLDFAEFRKNGSGLFTQKVQIDVIWEILEIQIVLLAKLTSAILGSTEDFD